MKVSFPHGTTKAIALEELKAHSSRLLARFGSEASELQQEWQENKLTFSFKARGFPISGTLSVEDEQIELEVELPLLARLMEGPIRDRAVQVMEEIFKPGTRDKGLNP
jgi:hypothetical protein